MSDWDVRWIEAARWAADMDPTTDPTLRSWVPLPEGSPFPIQNLPYGVFRRRRPSGESPGHRPRIGVAIGEHVLVMAVVAEAGLLPPEVPAEVFLRETLNGFLALGPRAWSATRARVSELLSAGNDELRPIADAALVPLAEAELLMPVEVGDYVDFYSSLHHATNLGRMFRPDADPLLPNWRHLPVGYHGRSGTLVVSGTPVVRPCGQQKAAEGDVPVFGPTARLDFELEVGFLTGPSNRLGEPIPPARAPDHIFGMVLVNDWSARDIQAWEYQPLGPLLGKSFATSLSPWVVPLPALRPYLAPSPPQDPAPLPYLRVEGDWGIDLHLEVTLATKGGEPAVISRTNARELYWTMPQQLAHATANGAVARPGDLFASGTISGPDPDTEGSMIELTRNGARPLELPGGATRGFLED
ncbi:MAG: fumarylacetoacetase, partial [Acidimicrobiia bacterium]